MARLIATYLIRATVRQPDVAPGVKLADLPADPTNDEIADAVAEAIRDEFYAGSDVEINVSSERADK
jgi:hypothetical protein